MPWPRKVKSPLAQPEGTGPEIGTPVTMPTGAVLRLEASWVTVLLGLG